MTDQLFPDMPVEQMYKARLAWEGMAGIEWWTDACEALRIYEPPPMSLKLAHAERKWELMSAYQKTIRRGDTALALRLVSAMCSLPAELGYAWKRVCCIAAEDIGPGCREAMNFVICAGTIYTPKKAPDFQYKVLCFLTELMCAVERSHDYCSMAVIEHALKSGVLPHNLSDLEGVMLSGIKECGAPTDWAVKNNWRGEGMLKFQMLDGPIASMLMTQSMWQAPEPQMMKGLPDYCYDTHTRVGKGVMIRLTGFKIIKDFFDATPTLIPKANVIGDAVFYEEGVLIAGGWGNPNLYKLEQRFEAAQLGWPIDRWYEFRALISHLIEDGAINKLREKVLDSQGY
jgi:hypothetical protein